MPRRARPRPSAALPSLGTALDGVVITTAGIEAFDCPQCGGVRELLVPSYGPDDLLDTTECLDRACAECGLALTVARLVTHPAPNASQDRRAG